MNLLDHYHEQFLRSSLPGMDLPCVRRARTAAFERFAELGFPTTRQEDWKYTSVTAIGKRAFAAVPAAKDGVSAEAVAQWALPESHLLVFANGRHLPERSRVGSLPRGATVTSLAGALAAGVEGIETLLGEDDRSNGFLALNAAFWADGAFIDLPAETVLERPIHLLFIVSETALAVHPHNIIRAGPGARAQVIEHYVGTAGPYLTNAVTRIMAEQDGCVTHTKLQHEGLQAYHIADIAVGQGRGSRFDSRSFALGGRLSRTEIATRLDGEGCAAELLGLYIGQGRQHVDHHTRIDHVGLRGVSREFYKGVLAGASRGVFNGRVIVHPDAQQTDALQSNRNLLLSDTAEVDAKPELEIYADDVKCSHGATVGQLDPEQIHYLRSRGIGEAAARRLLTCAFAQDVVDRVGEPTLRERLETLLRTALPEEMEAQS